MRVYVRLGATKSRLLLQQSRMEFLVSEAAATVVSGVRP